MGKILNYKMLGTAFKSLSDACFKADEQQRNGEKVTACGMSDDDIDRLCDIIPNGECKKRGHTRYFKKWDILHYIKSKRK